MSKSLPLAALHTFVEVGKFGSMKRAAETLCVSPGAISQQIKNLEDKLSVRLFTRTGREVQLTNAGRALFEQLQPLFDEVEDIWLNAPGASRRLARLTVSTTASFASAWLAPRLGHFKALNPDIEIAIECDERLIDLRRDYVDVAIRHGLGDYPGHAVVKIWTPEMVAVCSPELLRADQPIVRPEDCLAYPLLQDSDRADWVLWLRAHGIEDKRAQRGTSFSDDSLLVKAAVTGQGIALVRDIYVQQELADGRLVLAIDLPWPTQFAYYVVCDEERRDEWKIKAFREWVQQETENEIKIACAAPMLPATH